MEIIIDSNPSPSKFILKLWEILQNDQFSQAICWNDSGISLQIKNSHILQKQVLPAYFRHTSLKSFIRQLNMYAFKKTVRQRDTLIFAHPNFKKNSYKQISLIQRKISSKTPKEQKEQACIILDSPEECMRINLDKYQSSPCTQIYKIQPTPPTQSTQIESKIQMQKLQSLISIQLPSFKIFPIIHPNSMTSIDMYQQDKFNEWYEHQQILLLDQHHDKMGSWNYF